MVLLSPDHPVKTKPALGIVVVLVAKPDYIAHDPPIDMAFPSPAVQARRTYTTMELATCTYTAGPIDHLPYHHSAAALV